MIQRAKKDDLQGILMKVVRFSHTFQEDKQLLVGVQKAPHIPKWVILGFQSTSGVNNAALRIPYKQQIFILPRQGWGGVVVVVSLDKNLRIYLDVLEKYICFLL